MSMPRPIPPFRRCAMLAALALPLAAIVALHAQPTARLTTRWTAQVSADRVLPEYPRPQLVRSGWINLNGSWDYGIRPRDAATPDAFDGKILVPFAAESYLSGVQRAVGDAQRLWYRRTFDAPALPRGQRLLLHFGAVDWEAVVSINGREIGTHRGGYTPFTFDITGELRPGAAQELRVGVWDPADHGDQPRGKQVTTPKSIWYTSVTGIWQTVWLEPVPAAYIDDLQIVPDVDAGTLKVKPEVKGAQAGEAVSVAVTDGDRE